jgi:hypothetical protein
VQRGEANELFGFAPTPAGIPRCQMDESFLLLFFKKEALALP